MDLTNNIYLAQIAFGILVVAFMVFIIFFARFEPRPSGKRKVEK